MDEKTNGQERKLPLDEGMTMPLKNLSDLPSDYVSLSDVLDDELVRILMEDDGSEAPVTDETMNFTLDTEIPIPEPPKPQPQMSSAELQALAVKQVAAQRAAAKAGTAAPKAPAAQPAPAPVTAHTPAPVPVVEDVDDEEEDEAPRRRKGPIIAFVCLILLLIGLSTAGFLYYRDLTKDDGRILANVYVGDIGLGGMTKVEAANALSAFAKAYDTTPMVVELGENTITLTPEQTGAHLNTSALVDAAFAYGRNGSGLDYYKAKKNAELTVNRIPVFSYLNLDTNALRNALMDATAELSSTLTEPTVTVEGKTPALDPESVKANPDYVQMLTITLGTPGISTDANAIYESVLTAYGAGNFKVSAASVTQEPKPVNLDELAKTYNVAPIDAKSNPLTSEITPEVYGFGFDVEEVQKLLQAAKPGDTLQIPMTYVKPEVLEIDLKEAQFADTLAYEETYQWSNYNRATNLRLACEAINGVVVKPGEVFSYNETLGERTAEKGYLPATAYIDNEYAESLGGGICQVASTLYYACLNADLEIVERFNHMYPSDYVPLGMDATVFWGLLDYKFRNNTDHPIRIEAEYKDEKVCIALKGVDDKSTYVKMEYELVYYISPEEIIQTFPADDDRGYTEGQILQYGSDGMYVKTYRCRYDKATDKLISREYECASEYDPHNWIYAHIEEPETEPTEPPTEPTEPPTDPSEPSDPTEPSEDPTEPSEEPTDPPTEPAEG